MDKPACASRDAVEDGRACCDNDEATAGPTGASLGVAQGEGKSRKSSKLFQDCDAAGDGGSTSVAAMLSGRFIEWTRKCDSVRSEAGGCSDSICVVVVITESDEMRYHKLYGLRASILRGAGHGNSA